MTKGKALCKTLALVACVSAAVSAAGGAFEDAAAWYREVNDINGDGKVQAGEFLDVRHLSDASHFLNQAYPAGIESDVQTELETVVEPLTGIVLQRQCLKFRPERRLNNGAWQFRTGALKLPSYFTVSNAACFSVAMRFRIDDVLNPSNASCDTWIANCDNDTSNKNGIMLGFRTDSNVAQYGPTNFYMTVMFGGSRGHVLDNTWKSSAAYRFTSNQWINVALVLNNGSYAVYQLVEGGKLLTQTGTVPSQHTALSSQPSWHLGARAYNAVWNNNTSTPSQSFVGSIQEFATWSRALTEAEVFEIFTWSATDVFRLGVANGSSDEFGSGTVADDITVDGYDDLPAWKKFRGVLSGAHPEVTFRYACPANLVGLTQALRVRFADDSDAGTVTVSINGSKVKDIGAVAGQTAYAYVKGDKIIQGENTVALRVVSPGSGIKVDSIRFGGSWQVGFDNGSRGDMGNESQTTAEYWQADTNWMNCRRAVKIGLWNNTIRAMLPDDLLGRCAYRYTVKVESGTADPTHLQLYVNNVLKTDYTKSKKAWEEIAAEIAEGELNAGENQFRITRCNDDQGSWNGIDYYRLELVPPPCGLWLIMR